MNNLRQHTQTLIRRALHEDLGAGDVTSTALLPKHRVIRARILAKASGIVAGADVARWVFEALDRHIRCRVVRADGNTVRPGQAILTLSGSARHILAAERTALNLLGHLSGIATLTACYVRAVRPHRAKILDTRKTLPGLRLLEKYAVKVGGGHNHRFGLGDAILIKTTHLNIVASGEWRVASDQIIRAAVEKAKRVRPRKFVEIEVANFRELKAALAAKPNAILLDNWRLADIHRAVIFRNTLPHVSRPVPLLEVSGGVTLKNVRAIARTGVDRISIGRLTHSAPSLDVAMEVLA